jgi:predicted nicotinamide N-methyase
LTSLLCKDNTLTSLNIKNGNNINIITIEIDQNPDLECVLVDDVAYANTNFTSKDAQTYYSETTCP